MSRNVAQKLLAEHSVDLSTPAGQEIALPIDQTLTQDATGTLVMLELEAMELDRLRTELSVQYVDHNIVQNDSRNAEDHAFLQSAAKRFGLWYSRPGNGISHVVHMQRFGKPGRSLLGSDSHTCAAGALGMLAIGAGGTDVAAAMAGRPFHVPMPRIWGIRLEGRLPPFVSAKDAILELLRRHGVAGGLGFILEYHGPGLDSLSTMDRHVVANMGAELGATTSVFPSDGEVRRYLETQRRENDWTEIIADEGASYDREEVLDLSTLEPMIACPSSPGNVVKVQEVAGRPISQAYIGSSANPGYRDFAVAAFMLRDSRVRTSVSFDINPTSRQLLYALATDGRLGELIVAGARLHQAGCNGCIGMGQAPARGTISLRTTPRNFPGRSGTLDDQVYLCSPETAAASARRGQITDPRELNVDIPTDIRTESDMIDSELIEPPVEPEVARTTELVKGPNISKLPELEPLPEELTLVVALTLGDDVSTDEILPAGSDVLPLRSNIPAISEYVFSEVDSGYVSRAMERRARGGHVIVAGENYGQGSSREHAALAPRYLGLRMVIAKSFARIHRQNLVNFGVVPLNFVDPQDYERLSKGVTLRIPGLCAAVSSRDAVEADLRGDSRPLELSLHLSERQRRILIAGSFFGHLTNC
ncbi:MAG: aconitate hydratase [Planctomycetota bacterium]